MKDLGCAQEALRLEKRMSSMVSDDIDLDSDAAEEEKDELLSSLIDKIS